MAENMQDTKFILRTIELVIWECGWKNIFIKHYQGESDSDAKFFFCTVELTYINNTSKSDIHVPLQHQLVHQVGVHDVQQVRIEVVHVHLVKIVKKKDFIFVHLFNETQLSNLVFSRQLFLRTIKGPFYRRGQSMDIWCSRFPKQTTLIWNSPDADIYLQDPAIIITVNPKDILDDIYKKRKRQLIVTKLLPPFYSREKEWVFVWKADPVLRIPLQSTTSDVNQNKTKCFDIFFRLLFK